MTTLEAVKKFLSLINPNKINYFVSGGFALDAIRGKIMREHMDLDIYVFEEDLNDFLKKIKKEGYHCFKNLNKYEVQSKNLIVDILPIRKIGDQRVIIGNSADTYYPAKIFDLNNFYDLEDISIRLAPNELLVLEMPFSKHPNDKRDSESLNYDKKLFSQIRYVSKEKPKNIQLEEI